VAVRDWRGPTPRPEPEGSLFDVRRAEGNRARPIPGRFDPSHRGSDRAVAVNGVAGVAAQPRWVGPIPGTSAHALAYHRASRSKPAKLLAHHRLHGIVEAELAKTYSPEQIAGRLKLDFPDQLEMQVSTETIYQSLYVQSRGALKRDLTRCLRTRRAVRRPSRKVGQRKNRIPNMINIAERPNNDETRGGTAREADVKDVGAVRRRLCRKPTGLRSAGSSAAFRIAL
jgi:IS30 family transposase